MKTEADVRRYLDNLRTVQQIPCSCKASGHDMQCECGRRIMIGIVNALAWALDEDSHGEEEMVAWTEKCAEQFRAGKN